MDDFINVTDHVHLFYVIQKYVIIIEYSYI